MNKPNFTFRDVEAENCHGVGHHRYDIDGQGSKHIKCIALDTDNQLRVSANGNKEIVFDALMKAGLQPKERPGTNSEIFTITADHAPAHAIIDTALELSKTGAIDVPTSNQIVDREVKHLIEKKKINSVADINLAKFDIEEITGERQANRALSEPFSYLRTEVYYPHSAIVAIDEDASPAAIGKKQVMTVDTTVRVRDKGSVRIIWEALKTAGKVLTNLTEANKDLYITVEAPADKVASELGRKGHLPECIAQEIAEKAHKLHPNQHLINVQALTVT